MLAYANVHDADSRKRIITKRSPEAKEGGETYDATAKGETSRSTESEEDADAPHAPDPARERLESSRSRPLHVHDRAPRRPDGTQLVLRLKPVPAEHKLALQARLARVCGAHNVAPTKIDIQSDGRGVSIAAFLTFADQDYAVAAKVLLDGTPLN
eukprot:4940373-Prymnesium_polylepis.1